MRKVFVVFGIGVTAPSSISNIFFQFIVIVALEKYVLQTISEIHERFCEIVFVI